MPAPQSPSSIDRILVRWKAALGEETFAAAKPGQTLRPRTSIAGADNTVVQTSAPGTPAPPRSSFIPKDATLAQWGEYTVHDLVGEGGMGQIFRADQGALRRDVAIKKLTPDFMGRGRPAPATPASMMESDDKQEAFVSEALVTGFLDHPNIVPVYALGQDAEGKWFFSMKLVRGIAWKDLLHPNLSPNPSPARGGEPPPPSPPSLVGKGAGGLGLSGEGPSQNLSIDDPATRAERLEANLRILLSICNAVAFAHSKNIIHRDLKPENVMVGAFGEVLVMDWGLAVDVSETPPALASRESRVPHKTDARVGVGGTPDYMAPEQTYGEGASLSAQTDVFLLGAILFELLAGRPPNAAANVIGALTKASQCATPALPETIPQELRDICTRAMSKTPAARFVDASAFQQSVEDFLKHKESALIAAKAEQEAKTAEIPNLARAVVLYDQALALWRENPAARRGLEKARTALTVKERAARRVRRTAMALAAGIFLVVSIAFFWIRAEQERTLAANANLDTANASLTETNDKLDQKNKDLISEQQRTEAQKKIAESEAHNAKVELARGMIRQADAFLSAERYNESKEMCKQAWDRLAALNENVSDAEMCLSQCIVKIETTLFTMNHRKGVSSVAFSPDGKRLLSGGSDNTLKLWDAETGRDLRTLTGHSGWVKSVTFSPDGKRVLSGSSDKSLKLWDAETGAELRTFTGHSNDVLSVAFSPDGKQLLSGGMDNTLKLWDAETGEELRTFTGHSEQVTSVAISPDGKRLLSGSDDKTLKLWDADTGREICTCTGHSAWVTSVAFSPDGKRLLSGSDDKTLKLWDAETGREVRTFAGHSEQVMSVAFSPDGQRLLSGSIDKTLKLWDVETGAELYMFKGHSAGVLSVAFSPDGKRLLSGSVDETLKLWNAETGAELEVFNGHSAVVTSVAFSPDGKRVLSAGGWDKTLKLWDAETGRELRTFTGHSEGVTSVTFLARWKAATLG